MASEIKLTEISLESKMDISDNTQDNSNESLSSVHSNESSDGSESEQTNENKIKELEDHISGNPYHYNSHVELISLLRKAGELDGLRTARESMNKYFPLTSDLWIDWLTDETKLVSTKEERQKVQQLFERAVNDYLSVPVWLEYVQFSIGSIEEENGPENIHRVFENALMCAGLHVTEGAMLWDAYREFELALLVSLKDEEEQRKQRDRILSLFKRQLSVPLFDMEKTYAELEEWSVTPVDVTINNIYQKALKKLKLVLPFEEKLLAADTPRLPEYLSYLDFELKEGEPARIQCLFERALVDNCLDPSIWKKYTWYLDSKLKICDVSIPVYERAVRNCPWSGELWVSYITALERFDKGDRIKETVDAAFNSGVSQVEEVRTLWLAYINYLRRKISWSESNEDDVEKLRSIFQKAIDHLHQSFGSEGDPGCTILQYWAKIEAKFCRNLPQARELWSQIINSGHITFANKWLEYANVERAFGDDKHYRKVLLRGLMSARDWPETLGEALLKFEIEEGTLQTLDVAKEKYESQMAIIEEKRMKEATRNEAKAKTASTSGVHSAAKRKRAPAGSNVDNDGFKIPQNRQDTKGKQREPAPKKAKMSPSEGRSSQETQMNKFKDSDSSKPKAAFSHNPEKNMYTVFLSNLDYNIDEDTIRSIFEPVGKLNSLRLVRDYKGRSKGYCYVEYATHEAAVEALKLDRHPINGRPVFVSPCREKSSKAGGTEPKLKYSTGLEKSKLFVKGLPFSKTQEDVHQLFKEFGKIKEVRLVTYRNGHSKGLAYIEFEDESSATTALLKMDGFCLDANNLSPLSVAYSNPPPRKPKAGFESSSESSFQKALGGPSREMVQTASRGRSQASQMAFVPRALKQAASMASPHLNGTPPAAPKMSNDDFRNLLLKK